MLFWAANFYIVKVALNYYEPIGVAAWRFFFGVIALIFLVYFQFRKKSINLKFSYKEWWYLFLTAFFGIFLTMVFFNGGLKTTSAVNGSLIIATSPAITAILAYFILKRKASPLQWFAILLCFTGVAIILVNGDLSKLAQLQFEMGDIQIISMTIVFSLSQIIITKHLSHINSTVLTTTCSIIGLLLFILFSFPDLISTPVPISLDFWASILFMGVLGTGIAYTAFYYCVFKLGATISTLYMNTIPFFVLLLAFPFGETIDAPQIVGGSIILIGILTFNYSPITVRKLLSSSLKFKLR